ncbi:hypothetical protein IV203_026490 [Nitzschia inconspicua]|uniref:Uncharacterized protein n=1 Tax=Nitzschia inconspicua TaxID=303405 RepID=A0A9K3PXF7_9STRA|nr:hypothetical protein IV203_026490 [Nitzschia inconspicua]
MTARKSTFRTVFILFTILLLRVTAAGYQDEQNEHTDDAAKQFNVSSQDEIFLSFMFVIFGIVISTFGSLLAYVSCCEDAIMQEYRRNGIRVMGDVVTTEFTRGVESSDENALVKFESQREFFVTVQYTVLLSTSYPIRTRKQLRCLENDFWYHEHPKVNAILPQNSKSNTIFQDPCSCQSEQEGGALEMSLCDGQQSPEGMIEIATSAESFIKKFQVTVSHGKKLQLLVLPSHPLSALPVPQIERRLSSRYRMYSSMFVFAALTIAVFCYALATQFLMLTRDTEGLSHQSEATSWFQVRPIMRFSLLFILYFVFALLPLPCVHYTLRRSIQSSLHDEYFEQGDIIKGGLEDDSSLSTWNTDSIGGFKMSVESLSTIA